VSLGKNRRLLLLLLVLAGVLAAVFITAPSDEEPSIADEIFNRYRLLLKYRSITRRVQEGMDGRADELAAELAAFEESFLPGTNTAIGSAELQGAVGALAAESGLTLKTVKPLPLADLGDYVAVAIQADLSGGIRAFRRFIEGIATEHPGLGVSRLRVTVNNVERPGRLNVRITLRGLMKR